MSHVDATTESGGDGAERGEANTGSGLSTAMGSVRRAARSGTLFGTVGAVSLLQGVRRLRRGEVGGGLARLIAGGAFVAAARAQRGSSGGSEAFGGDRGTGIDQTDVVDTGVDLGDAAEGESGDDSGASGDEAAEVAGSSADVEDVAGADTDDVPRASGDEAADVAGSSADIEDAGKSGTELDSGADDGGVDQTDVVDTGVGEGDEGEEDERE
ncbi:hypothetical protein G9464_00105 [Halostella sp. JP-L12]|uniref:hypothetical protein n=1 Tax=Halostella TaxID=1843185 RepID=UPI000EF829F2|nr:MULTISPECIES: hypothetical protein [Halostella]NHN45998.1 hypothetical protein [Halostella sp. JP-L12]